MVKPASFDKNGMKRGAWSEEEDNRLVAAINRFGHPNWRLMPLVAGLKRCGKSCRLRWVNYLKPGRILGEFSKDEKRLIIKLHDELGNKWSAIAARLKGRTDNDIKNYWHAHIKKRRGCPGVVMRPQNLAKKEQFSDNNSSTITTTTTGPNPAENLGVLDSNAESALNAVVVAAAAADDDYLYEHLNNFNYNYYNFVEQQIYDFPNLGVSNWNYLGAAKPVGEVFYDDIWSY